MAHSLLSILLSALTLLLSQSEPTSKPAGTDPGKILEQLEAAGRDLNSIQCSVKYTVDDQLNISETTDTGDILYKKADPHPMFMVHFSRTVSDGRVLPGEKWWILRDRWLWEIKAKSKTIIKREVVAANQEVDFFDLEKTPFPLPFGQKKDQILKNFAVTLAAPRSGDPDGCDHLVCRPLENSKLAKDFRRLDLYVSRECHLPVRIVTQDANGSKVTTADFVGLNKDNLNKTVEDHKFDQPSATKDFSIAEEPIDTPKSTPAS